MTYAWALLAFQLCLGGGNRMAASMCRSAAEEGGSQKALAETRAVHLSKRRQSMEALSCREQAQEPHTGQEISAENAQHVNQHISSSKVIVAAQLKPCKPISHLKPRHAKLCPVLNSGVDSFSPHIRALQPQLRQMQPLVGAPRVG